MTKEIIKGKIILGDYMKAKDKGNIKITLKSVITFLTFIIIVSYFITIISEEIMSMHQKPYLERFKMFPLVKQKKLILKKL